MLGNDVNVKVDFLSKFVTGKISGHNSKMLEPLLSHSYVKLPVQKHLVKVMRDPMMNYFTRLSSACARTAQGVSMHATWKVEKRTLQVLEMGCDTIKTSSKKAKIVKTESLFGDIPLVFKNDSRQTVRKIKDIAYGSGANIFPRTLTGFKSATTCAVDFLLSIKVMIYAVIFLVRVCGLNAYAVRSPVTNKQVDRHILFKVTPDGTRRTKRAKCTKFQISQLVVGALRRIHQLNLFQFGSDVGESHYDCIANFNHIGNICEANFDDPVVVPVPLNFISRENFNVSFRFPPAPDSERAYVTWGCFLGGDLLSLLGVYGLNTRALMPCPVTPLTWDDMGNIFWFPYEETSGGHKIKEIMVHLLGTVVGPDGGRKGRKKIFFKNERTLTDSMCEFYTREDYHSFQEQILTWRDEFVNNLNKKKN